MSESEALTLNPASHNPKADAGIPKLKTLSSEFPRRLSLLTSSDQALPNPSQIRELLPGGEKEGPKCSSETVKT